jgi:hypothetical protein
MEIFEYLTMIGGIMMGMGLMLLIIAVCIIYLFREF